MDYKSPYRNVGLEEQQGTASDPTGATRRQLTGDSLYGRTVRSSHKLTKAAGVGVA